jgi:hypothetical protein
VAGFNIASSGSGYVSDDILSISNASVGGTGSGFQYTVSNNPGLINDITFSNRGSGYSISDVLTLPGLITGVTGFLQVPVSNVSATLGSGSQITVSSTTGIGAGYLVTFVSGTGQLDSNVTVVSVDGPTTLTITPSPIAPGSAVLDFTPQNPNQVTVSDATGIGINDFITVTSGSGSLPAGTFILGISGNILSLSENPTAGGDSTFTFTPSYGSGTGFAYTVEKLGAVESVTITDDGVGYSDGDLLIVSPSDLVSPTVYYLSVIYVQEVTFTGSVPTSAFSVGDLLELSSGGASYTVRQVSSSGGNITSILLDNASLLGGEDLIVSGNINTVYTVNSASSASYLYLIGDGISNQITPDLTFYVNSKYRFDFSDPSNTSHTFAFSTFPDGKWSPSLISNLTASITTGSSLITVPDTTGILPGMTVEQMSGSGSMSISTVVSVDSSTTFTVDIPALTTGSPVIDVYGSEYFEGVIRTATYLEIQISDTTPSTLYYYCQGHPNMGGSDGNEAVITVDSNNPNTFGSGFELNIGNVLEDNNVSIDIDTGSILCSSITSSTGTIDDLTSNNISASINLSSPFVSTNTVSSTQSLSIIGSTSVSFITPTVIFGSLVSIDTASGDVTTSGILKTTGSLNVDDTTFINGNIISTTGVDDINLSPASGRLVKVNSSTAFVIPSGNTSERPSVLAENGSIRFNTETNQYEGYSGTTSSWSSLGGVRDLDGNTTILAEEFVGANDNTLWFYNDNINTVRFTPSHLDFVNQKSIRSSNINAPSYVNWNANTPVSLGQYLKFRNNLYEVTVSGTTATSGNEPTHTTGSVANGSAELTWYSLAVAPLTFEDIEVLRIGPLGSLPVSINNDLRLADNTLSTDISDLVLRPNSGKKVIVDAPTSLVIPSGQDADRGIPIQGSIRFSQTSLQFEGYDGTNWGSLGGVKDVDQNTYIIPELSPGSNENILYFYNDNNNTLQITTNALDFYSIDTIRSVTTDELEITASLLTFDNATSTFDNTAIDRTFIHTTKQYFDLGLSAGLTTDPVLRLDDVGDVYLNIGFGTGSLDLVKVFDGDLKEFELADVKILTEKLTLVKGTSDNGSSELYAIATNSGCKTTVIAENPTSGDKEFIEFGILDNGTDVFHTEYGNIRTGTQLIIPTFEVTGSNIVRINIELGASVNPTESVNITVVSNVTKK